MRIVVKSIGDMPGKARGGLPLGCVLEPDVEGPPTVVAYEEGGTFSAEGLKILANHMNTYVAYFEDEENTCDNEPILIRAIDLQAALMWYREHYGREFALYVVPAKTYLGEFPS